MIVTPKGVTADSFDILSPSCPDSQGAFFYMQCNAPLVGQGDTRQQAVQGFLLKRFDELPV
ncbi:MAG: hypothetical protein P8Y45_09070 [Exilibacterium sp.]